MPLLSSCAGPSTASVATPPAAPSAPSALPFIEDDYPRALAEARASHRLLFIDGWAPWCHTCLSMRAYTFRDAKVRAHAGELVWASIDTEKADNGAWVAAHPMHAWPTLFVVDPETEKTILEWPNSATAEELVQLLDEARASTRHEGTIARAEARAREATALAASGKNDEAIAAWRDALAVAPTGWTGRAATLESLLDRLSQKKEPAACAETADVELPKVPRGGARAATFAVSCAAQMPAGDGRRALLDRAIARARAMAANADEPMLADDRSGLYEAIAEAMGDDGRAKEAREVEAQWASYLEDEARRAPDAAARAVFDAHRLEAYLELGTPEKAIPMLEQSAHDAPGDYNPPARLARALLAMKRYDEALVAVDRALGLAYGPRTLRIVATKADILEAKGDRAAAARTLTEAVAKARTGASQPRYAPLVDELDRRAHALEGSR